MNTIARTRPMPQIHEPTHYDQIMEQQNFSLRDLRDHLTGPVIALVLHIILIPMVIMMVVIDAPAEAPPAVETQVFEELAVVPEIVPEIEPMEVVPVDMAIPDNTRPETVTDNPEPPAEPEVITSFEPEPIALNIEITKSPKFMSNLYTAFGTTGGGTPGTSGGKRGGSGLEGTFYDFKQNASGNANGMTVENFTKAMHSFVTTGWKASQLNGYYRPPTRLYANCFFIPRCKAEEAPRAYRCEETVKPSRWAAIYRGRVIAPKTGRYRFVGAGDDVIAVRFNNDNVFDYGWTQLTIGKLTASKEWFDAMEGKGDPDKRKSIVDAGVYTPPVNFYKYEKMGHWNRALNGLAAGKVFSVEAGKAYPIEILISEIPGGEFGAALLIENVDETAMYPRDPTGAPILPLFRTADVVPSLEVQSSGECPPFFPGGEIWRIAAANYRPPEVSTANEELITIE